ncbi:MAG: hypothetical protein ABI132_11360 [Rhodanobacteraceae bacterium]
MGGKSVRYLQLTTTQGATIEYDIETLRLVDASVLDRFDPWDNERHRDGAETIVGSWMAQRFDRLALPDVIVVALDRSGVQAALLRALERTVHEIADVRVLVKESSDAPLLNFLIVFNDGAREAAQAVASAIVTRAELRAADLDGAVIIEGAHAVSADALTYAQWAQTRPFRAEYLSLRAEPPAELPPR